MDAQVEDALSKLYASVPGSREMVAKANGVLVFPPWSARAWGLVPSTGAVHCAWPGAPRPTTAPPQGRWASRRAR
jgi:hypothetical protein